VDYQEAYFAVEAGRTPKVNTKILFRNALNSFHSMADEFREIMKEEPDFIKEELITALRKYAKEEKLVRFRISAANIIEDFNAPFQIKLIQTGEILTDYFKDGFIVAHNFVSTANNLLADYPEAELLIELETNKKPLVESPNPSSIKKINTKFTVGQLAYLFRLLYDNEFTHAKSLADLSKFIAKHFKNNRTGDIDLNNLKNLLSSPTKNDAEKVADWLKDLMIKARNFEVKPPK
jgi:hypothetical protein